MGCHSEIIQSFYNLFIPLPSLILTLFSLHFIGQKLSNKVLVIFSTSFNQISADRISDIVLINKKNKPVMIFSIVAIIDNHYKVTVEQFNNPIILKPLETLKIETTPVSSYFLENEEIELPLLPSSKIDIYLLTSSKKIKCKVVSHPNVKELFSSIKNENYVHVHRSTLILS